MTDDPTRPAGSAPEEGADGRDEALAALLAVDPLDEPTRRRLVRRALNEVSTSTSSRRRPALLLGAAAALGVVVVAGVVLLARGGDHPPSQAARRSARPQPAAGPVAPGSAAQIPPRDLGPVGDVTSATRLRQVVAGPAGVTDGSLARIRAGCGAGGSVAGVTRVDTVGVGTDGGRPAGIVVGRDDAGRRTAVVVALDGCAPLQRLALG